MITTRWHMQSVFKAKNEAFPVTVTLNRSTAEANQAIIEKRVNPTESDDRELTYYLEVLLICYDQPMVGRAGYVS